MEPRKVRQLYEKAMKASVKREPAEPQRTLEQALKSYPRSPEALPLYGWVPASLGQSRSAEQILQAAIQSDPRYSPVYAVLADI